VPWNGWNETDFRTGAAEESIAGLAVPNDSPTVLGDGTTLTATVTSGTHVSYTWAFGDGDTSSGAVVTHTYPSATTYTPIVTASNSVSVLTATTQVTITDAADFTTRVITYVYDALNRLTGAEYSTGESYEYAYDAVGNREVMTTTAGTTTYQYDDANRLTAVGDVSYTWDDAGNLTHDGVFTYTWNGAGRLVQAQSVTATLVYTYNGDGVRLAQEVSTSAGTTVTEWVQDALGLEQVLVERIGATTVTYVYGLGRLSQVQDNGASHWVGWFLDDALGSARQVADDSGIIVLARDYGPYGRVIGEYGTGSSGYRRLHPPRTQTP
jgi:YD repeat-containing protein